MNISNILIQPIDIITVYPNSITLSSSNNIYIGSNFDDNLTKFKTALVNEDIKEIIDHLNNGIDVNVLMYYYLIHTTCTPRKYIENCIFRDYFKDKNQCEEILELLIMRGGLSY